MQGVDGRLSLRVGGELHEGTACSKRRTDEVQWVVSGQAGATGEGLEVLDVQSASDTGSQKVRQLDNTASSRLPRQKVGK